MCILCVIQKWARWVATLLPWLVIPLIGLWALSQLLPDELRFEITSPRLACVFVLLVTLFWYEILMPQLSAWRVRRYARLRERKRFEAIELEKLRKIATRRCRNCSTPYRDQNPGGGRFMCSYCGHSSKRPVLDLPVPPGMGISNSGIFKELVGKSGEILNGRVWSDKGLNCNQEWLQSGNLIGRSIVGKSTYWRKDDGGKLFRGDDNCLTGKSCSGGVTFACRLLTSFFFSIRWLWEKTFRVSSSVEDASSDMHRSMLSRRGDNGANCHESRGEKARRKAEEKRLARLEKELLEEEERKQREEVARLVEEQRRLRDEKLEARKDESKSLPAREKDVRKEVERKRHDRRKEKDKASSKRNSDAEEVEKRPNKESDQKRDFEKKSDTDQQEQQKSGLGSTKLQNMEPGPGTKNMSASNFVKGNTGNKYFDRMKGTILSSSRAFSGSGFFGKATTAPVNVTKENKFSSSADYIHSASHRRDTGAFDRSAGKTSLTMEDKKLSNVVSSESEVMMAPKRSWQQLFTRSTSTHSSSNPSVISRPNSKPQTAVQSPQSPVQSSSMQSFNNPINFGLPSPFNLTPYTNVSSSTSMGFSPPVEAVFPRAVHRPGTPEIIPEEPELFEDPCYVPDPLSLLGPVSESLDNFQLDVGASVAPDKRMERPHASKDLPTSPKGSKPSPIESPLSKLRNGENNSSSGWSKESSKNDNFHSKPLDDVNVNGKGTWQMWNSSLGQNGLSFIGGPENWLLPPEQSRAINNDIRQPSSGKTMASLFTKDGKLHSVMPSPQKNFLGKSQNGCTVNTVPVSSGNDPWMHNTFSPTLSGFDNRVPLKSWEKNVQNEGIYGSPISLPTDHPKHPYEHPSADCWSKNEFPVKELGDGVLKSSSATRPIGGGLFPSSDVQSLWSFD